MVHPCRLLKHFLLDRSQFDLHLCLLLLLIIIIIIIIHVAHVQNTQERGSSSFPKTSGVSLNIVGRFEHYRIEAATSDQLVPIMGQIFDAERQAEMQQNMYFFSQMMMTMNSTLMNSPCSCLSVYQPYWGPQTDVSGPEPCTFRVGTSSTVGHSISGPGPNQCDPMPTRRRQTVDKQSGPYISQLRSTSPKSAGDQLGSAVRQHDYDGVPVQSTYFHNSKLPSTLISFYIAEETILEVPHPMFSQLFVHPVVASFSCTSLEENMATPTDTDWTQVYTLMLKRLAKDLDDSHNRLKNALELNRIQEHQQRYVPNDRYFQTAGYTPENRLTTISESFAIFLQQTLSQQIEMTLPLRQLCVHLSCAICSHSSVAEHFQDVSLISHNGKLLGIKLHMNVPQIEHVDIDFKSCYAVLIKQENLLSRNLLEPHWRSQSNQFREFKLAHIRGLVKFLLQNSFFHVGTQVFRQHRGASTPLPPLPPPHHHPCCTCSEYSRERIIILSKNIGGFTEHCWTIWTLPHRSCYI